MTHPLCHYHYNNNFYTISVSSSAVSCLPFSIIICIRMYYYVVCIITLNIFSPCINTYILICLYAYRENWKTSFCLVCTLLCVNLWGIININMRSSFCHWNGNKNSKTYETEKGAYRLCLFEENFTSRARNWISYL